MQQTHNFVNTNTKVKYVLYKDWGGASLRTERAGIRKD
jgi:hypothetical protein